MPEFLEATFDKFAFRVATDRFYSREGLWAFRLQQEGGRRVRIGLTDYLQQHSGDMAFVHVQPVGTRLAVGNELAEIETIKATLSLPSPVTGTVIEVNPALDQTPEIVNQDPYEKGWLAVMEVVDWETEGKKLLEAQAYFSYMRSQIEQEVRQK